MLFWQSKAEKMWREMKKDEGWELPEKASWPLRLPIIRHIRFAYLVMRVARHYQFYGSLGLFSTGYDEWVLYAIRRGWC